MSRWSVVLGVVVGFLCSSSAAASPAPAVKADGKRLVVTWKTDRTLRASERYVVAFVSLHRGSCDAGGKRNRSSVQRRRGRTVKVTLSTLTRWCRGSGYVLVDVDRGGELRNLVTRRLRL